MIAMTAFDHAKDLAWAQNKLSEKDAEIKRLQADVAEAVAALAGAQVLAECYFDDHGRDPVNNDNYCRIVDWLTKHTALAGKEIK